MNSLPEKDRWACRMLGELTNSLKFVLRNKDAEVRNQQIIRILEHVGELDLTFAITRRTGARVALNQARQASKDLFPETVRLC